MPREDGRLTDEERLRAIEIMEGAGDIPLTFSLPDPGDLASKTARLAVKFLSDPENLAGLSGELLLPLVVFRGRRVPFIPFLIVALMGYAGGRMGYRSYKNLETLARSVTPMVVTDDA